MHSKISFIILSLTLSVGLIQTFSLFDSCYIGITGNVIPANCVLLGNYSFVGCVTAVSSNFSAYACLPSNETYRCGTTASLNGSQYTINCCFTPLCNNPLVKSGSSAVDTSLWQTAFLLAFAVLLNGFLNKA